MGERIVLGSAGVLAPGRWLRARALGWMLALALGLLAVAMLSSLPVLALSLGYVVYAAAVQRGERRRPAEIMPVPADLAIGLLIGLGMFTLVMACLSLMGAVSITVGDGWSDWPNDLMEAGFAALLEELIFRAVVFRLLMRAFGAGWALALSAAIFGALHLANPNATLFAGAAIAIEAGLMLASFYLLTGRIWMSVGVHAAWNLTQGGIFGASVSGHPEKGSLLVSTPVAGAPAWASGGAFGPEASLSAIIVGLAVFVVVIAVARRRGMLSGVD
jgi:uncharacterized protein